MFQDTHRYCSDMGSTLNMLRSEIYAYLLCIACVSRNFTFWGVPSTAIVRKMHIPPIWKNSRREKLGYGKSATCPRHGGQIQNRMSTHVLLSTILPQKSSMKIRNFC